MLEIGILLEWSRIATSQKDFMFNFLKPGSWVCLISLHALYNHKDKERRSKVSVVKMLHND